MLNPADKAMADYERARAAKHDKHDKQDGGQAFPRSPHSGDASDDGMTLRQYAAIKLRVPDSGTDWLDDMIRESLRDEFAGNALQGILAKGEDEMYPESRAKEARALADAMLRTRSQS